MVRHDPGRNLPVFWETPAALRSTFLLVPLMAFLLGVEICTEFVTNVPLMVLVVVPAFVPPALRMPLKPAPMLRRGLLRHTRSSSGC